MFHNGWEFYILNPFSKDVLQTTQELYVQNYNKSYIDFINLLLIPEPFSLFFDELGTPVNTFVYYTSCEKDSDIINKDSEDKPLLHNNNNNKDKPLSILKNKESKPITSYKPTGKLIYNNDILDSLRNT